MRPSASSDRVAVSVLLPARNAGSTLGCALASVARQTHRAWECIVLDDGSSDQTRDEALRWANADSRFRVVAGPARGLVAALNEGLRLCRGELVARMDADDWMHPRRLELQIEHLQARPELSAVGARVHLFPRATLRAGLLNYERWLNAVTSPEDVRRELFVECPIAHPTLLIRSAILLRYGYHDRNWPEDYDLVQRLLADGHELAVTPRRLHGWRDGPARLSRTGAAYRQDRFVACKAYYLVQSQLRTQQEYVLWGYGDTGRCLARALREHGRVPSHIVEVHPGRIGQRIAGARVIAPEQLPNVPRRPIVVSVAGETPRSDVRRALSNMGFREGRDYVCAA